MRLLNVLLAALFTLSLSACAVTEVKGKVGGMKVKVEDEDAKDSQEASGKFCPPGQAKKGHC